MQPKDADQEKYLCKYTNINLSYHYKKETKFTKYPKYNILPENDC